MDATTTPRTAFSGAAYMLALEPLLDAYGAELARHDHAGTNFDADVACACGWVPRRQGGSARRSVGVHIAAAHKRAEVAFDAAAEQLRTSR